MKKKEHAFLIFKEEPNKKEDKKHNELKKN